MSKFFDIFKKNKIVTTGDNNIPVEEENESHSMLTDVSVGLTLTASNNDIDNEPELIEAEPCCSRKSNVIDMNTSLSDTRDKSKSCSDTDKTDLADLGNLISGPMQPLLKV